jgi:hypothetical protein
MTYERHDIEEIEGIGPGRAAALRDRGIVSTEDLLERTSLELHRTVGDIPRFPTRKLPEYRAHAELVQVDGLGPQHAEALYRAGRTDLLALARPNPSTLVEDLAAAVRDGLAPEGIDEATAVRWQKRALTVAYTGTVVGRVLDEGGDPVAGAVAYADTERGVTDETGTFRLPAVPYGNAEVVVRAEGYRRATRTLPVRPDVDARHVFELTAGADDRSVDESEGDVLEAVAPDDELVFEDVALGALADGTPLHFRHRYRDGRVRLHGVYRKRVGNRIVVSRVVVPGDAIGDAAPGDVYYVEGGDLRASDETIGELRRRLATAHLAEHGVRLVPAPEGFR